MAELASEGHGQRKLAIVDLGIHHLDRPGLKNRAAADQIPIHRKGQLRRGGNRPVVGNQSQDIAFHPEHRDVVGMTEARGTLRHGVQHRLEVGRGACDYPQDLARRRLLLQRLSLALQRLRQALLKVADFRAFVL